MLFGPLPIHFVNRLRERLHANGGSCQVFSSAGARDRYRAELRARGPQLTPNFNPQHDLLYIEIETRDLLIVKGELAQMGIPLVEKDFDPQLERAEFLCPRCDHRAEAPGICPKHGEALLEFSAWAGVRRARRERVTRRALQGFILALLALVAIKWFG